ncbi:ATP-binding cassette domain-containing protein [Luteococcus sp. Sow4_B9]|uniref:ATP-binding cassette domain-containing protein n=1 Tax=Luteococcus sp. Sow4_B9 TaxID=3438792 RepID=UPI003F9B17CA
MLEIDRVTVAYGSTVACQDISLALDTGLHALIGPNGAGKSSLMSVVSTLRRPSSGTIRLDGQSRIAERRLHTSFLPQENLPEKSRFNVADFVRYMCWLRKVPRQATNTEVDRVLECARLTELRDKQLAELSGGQRRRVGIAATLTGQPRLLVLDEPSAGLDIAQRSLLAEVLQEAAREAVVLVSTHIVEDVLDTADTVTVLAHGRILHHGPDFAPPHDLKAFEQRYLALVTP